MIQELKELTGLAFLCFGLFFCFVGVVGVNRMPNTPMRLHASCKVGTLGVFGCLFGAICLMPLDAFLRLIVLALFVLLTASVTAHAIAAGWYRRIKLAHELENELSAKDDTDGEETIAIDVTGVLSRSRLDEIMEALERTQQRRDQTGG